MLQHVGKLSAWRISALFECLMQKTDPGITLYENHQPSNVQFSKISHLSSLLQQKQDESPLQYFCSKNVKNINA